LQAIAPQRVYLLVEEARLDRNEVRREIVQGPSLEKRPAEL